MFGLRKSSIHFLFLLSCTIIFSSCYKDNEEELYPQVETCDSTDVSYASTISSIIQLNCYGCHSNSASGVAGAGISFEGHENISSYISNNQERFLGAIQHLSGYSPMPKGGQKLNNCDISKIKNWINEGVQDN